MSFTVTQKVLFRHCDPAGIIFYPRYFEMINDLVETWFDIRLGHPFEALHHVGGVPTASFDIAFTAPTAHGDVLDLTLTPTKLGRTSLHLTQTATCAGEIRYDARQVLVHVGRDLKPMEWPTPLRAAIENEMEGAVRDA